MVNAWGRMASATVMLQSPALSHPLCHLPPRLQELCAILARGLARLHSHTTEELGRDAAQAEDLGENSLRHAPHQSGHANRTRRRLA